MKTKIQNVPLSDKKCAVWKLHLTPAAWARNLVFKAVLFALLVANGVTARAQGSYPDPDNIPLKAVSGEGPQKILLLPGQTATITATFVGPNTGCALIVHDPHSQKPIVWLKHDRAKSPETIVRKISNMTNDPITFLLSAFTYIGGPPLENGVPWVRDSGYHQVQSDAPHHDESAKYVCHGSSHGPTVISDNVIIAP